MEYDPRDRKPEYDTPAGVRREKAITRQTLGLKGKVKANRADAREAFKPVRAQLGAFIGRFVPWHEGHNAVKKAALESCDRLVVLVGSSFKARSTYTPWTFAERKAQIEANLTEEERARVLVLPLLDSEYNNDQWKLFVQEAVAKASEFFFGQRKVSTALVGHSKDHSSFYLKMFPQWQSVEIPNFNKLSATPIREDYFVNGGLPEEKAREYLDSGILSQATVDSLIAFEKSEVFDWLVDEYDFIEQYRKDRGSDKEDWRACTSDVVAVQSGHVLLIRRRSAPGKGMLALPGGFVKRYQTFEDAAWAELFEETGLTKEKIGGQFHMTKIFDDPNRSPRGRLITQVHLVKLPDNRKFPPVKGGDDADRAMWVPISEIDPERMFEDHYALVMHTLKLSRYI